MKGIWEGDEDFGDGRLKKLFSEYNERKVSVDNMGLSTREHLLRTDMEKVKEHICDDEEFLTRGSEESNVSYNQMLDQETSAETKVMECAWNALEFQELLKSWKVLKFELENAIEMHGTGAKFDLMALKLKLKQYLKDLMLKKRIAAKYLLVFMIADELRNRKPYAMPVQFLPYKSITDAKLIELASNLQDVMEKNGMTVVFVGSRPRSRGQRLTTMLLCWLYV